MRASVSRLVRDIIVHAIVHTQTGWRDDFQVGLDNKASDDMAFRRPTRQTHATDFFTLIFECSRLSSEHRLATSSCLSVTYYLYYDECRKTMLQTTH